MNLDDSIELLIQEYKESTEDQRMHTSIEKSITHYLRELGLKMKTDPGSKKDIYYERPTIQLLTNSPIGSQLSISARSSEG